MFIDIIKTNHCVLHMCLRTGLAIAASAALLAGCGFRVGPVQPAAPSTIPVPSGEPAQQAPSATPTAEPTAEPALAVTATPTATELNPSRPVSASAFLSLLPADLSASRAVTLGQFTVQYPKDGFMKTPARKQMGTAANTQNPFLALFPELRTMPAPAWLKEGTRVTYHVMSASIAQKPGEDGSAGEGYNQYDLVALEDGAAVSSACLFSILEGAIMPSLVMRTVDLPAAGDYWINPDVLKDAERAANDDLAVYHTPYKLGEKTYNATRFEYKLEDAEYVWVFDEDTGLMLFYRHNLGTDASDYRQMAQITLVRQRQLKLPWRAGANAAPPAWAKEGTKLNYSGSYAVILNDGTNAPLKLNVVAQIVDRGERWLDWQVKTTLQYQTPSTGNRAAGMAQPFDAYWLPAEAIKSLKNGQVIDRDPVTGAKITATRGQGTVTLTERNDSFVSKLTYDTKTGALISAQQDSQIGAGTLRIKLELTNQ